MKANIGKNEKKNKAKDNISLEDNAKKVIELTRFNVRMIIFKYNYRKLMPKMLLILMWALLNQ